MRFYFTWEAIFLSTLGIVNEILSSIPPFAICSVNSADRKLQSDESKQLYVDMFLNSDTTIIQRARKAWAHNMYISTGMADSMPLGIQIELYFCDCKVVLSPFTCAYYLQFLCYHEMSQYGRRNRALQQLIEAILDHDHPNLLFSTFNIAGHCLLLTGQRMQARDMFYMSYTGTRQVPPHDKYNSALWYLQNYF